MTETIVHVRIVGVQCFRCKAWFGMDQDSDNKYRENHKNFTCPYCSCVQHYTGMNEVDRLKRELEGTKYSLDHVRSQRDRAERRAAAAKGQVTKIRKRVAHGVCPCCNRHFVNLQRHMESKHPDTVKKAKAK